MRLCENRDQQAVWKITVDNRLFRRPVADKKRVWPRSHPKHTHIKRKEIQQVVDKKTADRARIQKDIETISEKRGAYIANEKKKAAAANKAATLESEVEKIIKKQAVKYKMKIEE